MNYSEILVFIMTECMNNEVASNPKLDATDLMGNPKVNNLLDNYSKLTDSDKANFLIGLQNDSIFKEITNLLIEDDTAIIKMSDFVICKLTVYEHINSYLIGQKSFVIKNGNKYSV